jgi:hypothetical protein
VSQDARLQAILRSSAQRAELFPIVTTLKADAWERRIEQAGLVERFGDVPDSIRYGFSHGLDSSRRARTTFIPPNLKSALEHPDVISAYIEKEQTLGRISIGYDPVFLESKIGPFRCSPVGCVQKDAPNGKWRMFNHHSFPYDDPDVPSINSQINKDDFPCDWGSFAQCYLILARAPPGAQASIFSLRRLMKLKEEYRRQFSMSKARSDWSRRHQKTELN